MSKYQRIMKKYYKHKKKNQNKVTNSKLKKTYFDSLFTRFFLSSLLLLLMTLLNIMFNINIKHHLNNNFNFTKIGYNLLSIFIENNDNQLVSSFDLYDLYKYKDNKNILESSSYNGVNCFKAGTVIKIEKENNKYNVTIQTIDDYLWTYSGLESIDCYLYQYISDNELIGTSIYDSNFSFELLISKNNQYFELNTLC